MSLSVLVKYLVHILSEGDDRIELTTETPLQEKSKSALWRSTHWDPWRLPNPFRELSYKDREARMRLGSRSRRVGGMYLQW